MTFQNSNPKSENDHLQVTIPHLEVNIVYACNLKCEYCNHLGRYMKGLVQLDELTCWFETWKHKIKPNRIILLGGEPLLHPKIEAVLHQTRMSWPESKLILISNGLLFSKMPDSFWNAIHESEFMIVVSKHFDDSKYQKLFEQAMSCLNQWKLDPWMARSDRNWAKSYRLDSEGNVKPFVSDPCKAWKHCSGKRLTTLMHNCLYPCPQLACFSHACREGFISRDWRLVLEYRPLTPDATAEEVASFIKGGHHDQCALCPERYEWADAHDKHPEFVLYQTTSERTIK